jgi:hypothetical protein
MEDPETTSSSWSGSDKLAFALFCLATITGIVLYWVDKTPVAAGISIAVIAALVVYPIWHFVQKSERRIIVFIFAALLIVFFGWKIWPVKPTVNTGSESVVPPQQSATQQQTTTAAPKNEKSKRIETQKIPLAPTPSRSAPQQIISAYDELGNAIQLLNKANAILEEVDARDIQYARDRSSAETEYPDPASKARALEQAKEHHDLMIAEIKGRVDDRWQQISPSISSAFGDAQNWLKLNNHLTHNEADDEAEEFRTAMQQAQQGTDTKRFAALETCLKKLSKKVGTYQ